MTSEDHLQTAKGCLMDLEFQHDKMQGLLAFMLRLDDENPPDYEDIKLAFVVLQNLLGEAQSHLKDFDRHYGLSKRGNAGEGD